MLVVGIGVLVGYIVGVAVAGISDAVGVHEGIRVNRNVTVGVGVNKAGFAVGGGKGLRLLLGLIKIMVTAETTQHIETSDRMVRMFHTMFPVIFRLGSFVTSDISYESMFHLPSRPVMAPGFESGYFLFAG
jgi:hypothetical protein